MVELIFFDELMIFIISSFIIIMNLKLMIVIFR